MVATQVKQFDITKAWPIPLLDGEKEPLTGEQMKEMLRKAQERKRPVIGTATDTNTTNTPK